MAQFNFPLPPSIDEMLRLLNEHNRRLRLTLVRPDGSVQGHYATEYGTKSVGAPGAPQFISGSLDDSHVLFVADSMEQAGAFLCGTFLGAFGGRPMEDVQSEISRKRIETDF